VFFATSNGACASVGSIDRLGFGRIVPTTETSGNATFGQRALVAFLKALADTSGRRAGHLVVRQPFGRGRRSAILGTFQLD
jgi:hypothetical protein